ncbi:hypothetical protein Tco_0932004 [Tanacetum coccineum]
MYAASHLLQLPISHPTLLVPSSHEYQSQISHQTSSVPQNAYHSPLISTQPLTEFPRLDSGLLPHDSLQPTINLELPLIREIKPLFKMVESLCNKFKGGKYKVMLVHEIREMLQVQRETMQGDRQRYPFGLSKPLPLVESRNLLIVPGDYFFNNDLAYLQGGSTDKTYTTSLTKTNAAKYKLKGIEDMFPTLWSPIKVVYDKHAALGTSH